MDSIPMLLLPFDLPLRLYEVPAFRGAILEQVPPIEMMHNHIPPKKQAAKYAVVQYKSYRGKAAILMIGRGIDAAGRLLTRNRWEINLRERVHPTTSFSSYPPQLFEATVGPTASAIRYRIHSWLPFNQKQYAHYLENRRLLDRVQLLEQRLIQHILAFASGMEIVPPNAISLAILDTPFLQKKELTVKRQRFLAFNIDFETNFQLPPYVGLGAKTAFGYGMVTSTKR